MLAKDFAQSGDATNCIVYLRRAADEGYKEVGKARTDPPFAKVITDPNVKALSTTSPPNPLRRPPAPRYLNEGHRHPQTRRSGSPATR